MNWKCEETLMKILMLSLLLLLLLLFLEFIVVEIEFEMFVVVVFDGNEEIVVVSVNGNRFMEKEIVDGNEEFVVIICCESMVSHVCFLNPIVDQES
ncbi:hypothetical protein MtrunA17_Chr5g0427381 [Medicago truncatula]|nr:hypothetical protein MtrunA17_Chr5g0427381 [Medicago truncatula]